MSNTNIPVEFGTSGGQVSGWNALINGAMSIWQRGTSFTSAGYTADRWYVDASGSSNYVASQQITAQPGFQYANRLQRNIGQTWVTPLRLAQVLETVNSIPYQKATITLSFYAKCGTNFSAANTNLVSRIALGQGANQSMATMLANTWTTQTNNDQNNTLTFSYQRFTQTINVAQSTTQIGIEFLATPTGVALANDWIEIVGVQLEVSSVATPFQIRSYADELRYCQRYYEIISLSTIAMEVVATRTYKIPVSYNASKRSAPISNIASYTNYGVGGVLTVSGYIDSFYWNVSATSTGLYSANSSGISFNSEF